mgnify:FL=1
MRPDSRPGKVIFCIVQIVFVIFILAPILYAVDMSILPMSQIFKKPLDIIPRKLDFSYYKRAFEMAPLFRYLLNTLLVSALITVGQLILSGFAAFSFSHFHFKGKKVLFLLVLSTMMIPGESIAISNYMTVAEAGLLDTYAALIFPSLASAMSIFFLRQSFLQMPKELYEVACVEGSSNLRYFFTILLPLSKGSMGAVSLYIFINSWNAYMWPLLVTNSEEMRTVQIGIGMLLNAEASEYNVMMAGVVIVMIPTILIFAFGQKYILSGILTGAVKG